jgi:hypothetical protein
MAGTALERHSEWHGLREGDPVVVEKELRQNFVFVAHVRNTNSGEEWVEVRGGKNGDMKTRSFRPEQIYPPAAKKGAKLVGLSFAHAPRLSLP